MYKTLWILYINWWRISSINCRTIGTLGIRPCATNYFYPSIRHDSSKMERNIDRTRKSLVAFPLLFLVVLVSWESSPTPSLCCLPPAFIFHLRPIIQLCNGFVNAALEPHTFISTRMYRWTVPGKPKKAIVLLKNVMKETSRCRLKPWHVRIKYAPDI